MCLWTGSYTLAIVLAEALGLEDYAQELKNLRHRCGRGSSPPGCQGIYDAKEAGIPPELLEKYYHFDGQYTFAKTYAAR